MSLLRCLVVCCTISEILNCETIFLIVMQAAKRHLTQRIERLDDKLDKQKALSGQIRDDVLSP